MFRKFKIELTDDAKSIGIVRGKDLEDLKERIARYIVTKGIQRIFLAFAWEMDPVSNECVKVLMPGQAKRIVLEGVEKLEAIRKSGVKPRYSPSRPPVCPDCGWVHPRRAKKHFTCRHCRSKWKIESGQYVPDSDQKDVTRRPSRQ